LKYVFKPDHVRRSADIVVAIWRFALFGNVVGRINDVNGRRSRLVLGWVTVGKRVNHLGM